MKAQETFTSEELIAILRDRGVDVESVLHDVPDGEASKFFLECEQGQLPFRCLLAGDAPDFSGVILFSSILFDGLYPFEVANRINHDVVGASAYVGIDDNGDVEEDEDGNPQIFIQQPIWFYGGITAKYLGFQISTWLEALYDIFEVDDSDQTEAVDFPVLGQQIKEMGIVEQIEWILGSDSVSRTARELASFLMTQKQEVNSALYRHPEKFEKDGTQPPRWTLQTGK